MKMVWGHFAGMKICMMTNTYLPHVGGVARSVHTFAEDYRALGHETVVVAPSFPDLEEMDPAVEKEVIRVPALQRFNGSDFSVRLPLIGLLQPRLFELEVDLIHSHHPFLIGDTALRFAADKQVPVIFTHHTLYEEYLHYVPFRAPAMRQFVIELSTHYANLCDAVVAPSQSIADLIRRRGVEVPVTVIPTGIDLALFGQGDGGRCRRRHGIDPERFVVGTLGRLAEEKNLGYLCRAVGNFLRRVPDGFFLAVGSGPAAGAMRKELEIMGVGDRVLLPGKKCGQDLYDAYKAMDLFVFSSFSETQGLVLAEAMAAATPVVALDASGVREVVRNHENGLLLEGGASEAVFAEALCTLRVETDLRRRLSRGAVATAQGLSREASARRALTLYQETLRRARRRRTDYWEDLWDGVRHRLKLEWELFAEKAESALEALRHDEGRLERKK